MASGKTKNGIDKSIDKIDEEINELVEENDVTKIYDELVKTDTKIFDTDDEIDIENNISDNDCNDENNSTTKELSVIRDDEIKKKRNKVVSSSELYNEQLIMDTSKRQIKIGNQTKKRFKIIIFILLMLVIIVSLIIASVLFQRFSNEKNNEENKKLSKAELQEIVDDYGEELEEAFSDYLSKSTELLTYDELTAMVDNEYNVSCSIYDLYEDGNIYLNKCTIEDEKGVFSYGVEKEKVVIDASTILKVYVDNSSGLITFDKPIGGKGYTTYEVYCGEEFFNPTIFSEGMDFITYYNASNEFKIMNFKTNEKALPLLDYQSLLPIKISDNLYDNSYVAVKVNGFWGVYGIVDGRQIISPTYRMFVNYSSTSSETKNFVEAIGINLLVASDGTNYGIINYSTNKVVVPFEYGSFSRNGDYIFAKTRGGENSVYDFFGKEYLTKFSSIDAFYEDKYFLVSDNENKKIVQIDGTNLYDYGIINNMGDFYSVSTEGSLIKFDFSNTNENGRCMSFHYDISNSQGDYVEYDC